MKLNRSLIKNQSRNLIKGKVFPLFLFSLVVIALVDGIYGIFNIVDSIRSLTMSNIINSIRFGDLASIFSNIDDFGASRTGVGFVGNGISIVGFVLSPLTIALAGVFVQLIRGNDMKLGEYFKYTFSTTFNESYGRKLLFEVLYSLIIIGGFCLFIIPGIVFVYKYSMARMIMSDYPQLTPVEALKASAKLTADHKGELFVLDLSFIGWGFLCAITCGLVGIYVLPYYQTVWALYYENFRIRSFQEGRVTASDFGLPIEPAQQE